MDKKILLDELSKLLEVKVENLDDNFVLKSSDLWDSLSFVSMIAFIDAHYQISISGEQIEACKTIGNIFELINKKIQSKNNIIILKERA